MQSFHARFMQHPKTARMRLSATLTASASTGCSSMTGDQAPYQFASAHGVVPGCPGRCGIAGLKSLPRLASTTPGPRKFRKRSARALGIVRSNLSLEPTCVGMPPLATLLQRLIA